MTGAPPADGARTPSARRRAEEAQRSERGIQLLKRPGQELVTGTASGSRIEQQSSQTSNMLSMAYPRSLAGVP